MSFDYGLPEELILGTEASARIPREDQQRQRREAGEILDRLKTQPGVILADEVGMGKTFVALAAAYSVARQARSGPVVIMVPANLVDKWVQDLKSFCQLYTPGVVAVDKHDVGASSAARAKRVLFGVARHSVDFMRLLDDPIAERCQVILLAQGAMSRRQSDKWVRLAFIAEAFRRHGRRAKLARVKKTAYRFLGELLEALGEQRSHEDDEGIWANLMRVSPQLWREKYNAGVRATSRHLEDDPVPKALVRALHDLDLKPIAEALEQLPIRVRGDDARMKERIHQVRDAIRSAEGDLWLQALAKMPWRSPLLVLDEAHHLKNPKTTLAQMFQELDEDSSRVGAGAIYGRFDRMCFLTATPFQLGHRELINVLRRFDGVRWDRATLGERNDFEQRIETLIQALDQTQRSAIHLQRTWARLDIDSADEVANWDELLAQARESLQPRLRAALDAFDRALQTRVEAQHALQPWIIRHNKGTHWDGGVIVRRVRREGASVVDETTEGGIKVPGEQLLPFFLAARSAVQSDKDLLGEALASSYEAFRRTRESNRAGRDDEEDEPIEVDEPLTHPNWYLDQFDKSLEDREGHNHPKVHATVRRVADLWEKGEKVLVFAFYRKTCQALRFHISREMETRLYRRASERLGEKNGGADPETVSATVSRVQRRFFDDDDGPGRRAIDGALSKLIDRHTPAIDAQQVSDESQQLLVMVMRRFLRVRTTILRSFPLEELGELGPEETVRHVMQYRDASDLSTEDKMDRFVRFLIVDCSPEERENYLDAAARVETGRIQVEMADGSESDEPGGGAVLLANVQLATGETRRDQRARLMRGFNTPFFPDILVCSQVMGEGVDLHRACRHVIHHDLAWSPSQIEQRTGRIDRLGCKAEGRYPIAVDLPYLAGMTDERQFKVMTDREQWFRVVMGQEEVANLIAVDGPSLIPFPDEAASQLSFRLGL